MQKFIAGIFFISVIAFNSWAQSSKPDANEAIRLFKAGEFSEALPMFESLFNDYSKEPRYNYYFGACLVETNTNLSQAAKCLKYAGLKNFNKELYYYLGRSYQLLYEFSEAIDAFKQYLKLSGLTGEFRRQVLTGIGESQFGLNIATKIFTLKVVRQDTVDMENLLSAYSLSSDMGKLMENTDFFESGIDPDGVMFMTERQDMVLFTLKLNESQDKDLYRMDKLIDGWGENIKLAGDVNTKFSELYPVLHTDGVTLYFSSNREGGLGGYDIYKATYNAQTKSFENITNMGIPFNSPRDDFFFVPDDYKNQAWFASNRSTTDGRVIVYSIVWDNSVVRNSVSDMYVVREASVLEPDMNLAKKTGARDKSTSTNFKAKSIAEIHFIVADTLEYTQFSDFLSSQALSEFKQGAKLSAKKDSLTQVMKEKRRLYSLTRSDSERNKLVNEILSLEKQTYAFDDAIEEYNYRARNYEQEKVRELIRQGKYKRSVALPKSINSNAINSEIVIPEHLTIYTNDEFGRRLLTLSGLYDRLFSAPEVAKLQYADSLFVYGNSLNLESSKMLEKVAQSAETPEMKLPRPFKGSVNQNNQVVESEVSMKKSRELKKQALLLYHKSLDIKYQVYRQKYRELKSAQPKIADYEYIMSSNGDAFTFYKSADEVLSIGLVGIDNETFEKAGSLKRNAVENQEKGLLHYLDILDGKKQPIPLNVAKAHTPNPIVEKANVSKPISVNTSIDSAGKAISQTALPASVESKPIYKIQIGVFRNQPELNGLPNDALVTKELLPDSGLTKYYVGLYQTYAQAIAKISSIRDGGFDGAFVVAFVNQKAISMSLARDLEGKY